MFIVAGRVRVAFEPKSFQSDFNRIRYNAPDGHCDSVQSRPLLNLHKKFILTNVPYTMLFRSVRITSMCQTRQSDSYNRRYYARTKTATFEFLKKTSKTRGWNLSQFDKENEFFRDKVLRVYRSRTSQGCVRAEIVSIGLQQDKV